MDNRALTISANNSFLLLQEKDKSSFLNRLETSAKEFCNHSLIYLSQKSDGPLNSAGKYLRGVFKRNEDDGLMMSASRNLLNWIMILPQMANPLKINWEKAGNYLKKAFGGQNLNASSTPYIAPQNIDTVYASEAFGHVVNGYVAQTLENADVGVESTVTALQQGYLIPVHGNIREAYEAANGNTDLARQNVMEVGLANNGLCFSAEHNTHIICAQKLENLRSGFEATTTKTSLGSNPVLVFRGVTQTVTPELPIASPNGQRPTLIPLEINAPALN